MKSRTSPADKAKNAKKNLKRLTVILGIAFLAVTVICLKNRSDSATPEKLSADELLALGDKYLHELNYEQALVQFQKVIEIDPKNVHAYLGGTDAYLHLNRTQDAVDWLTAGTEASDNKNLSMILADVKKSSEEGYIALGKAWEAEGWYERASELQQRMDNETGEEISESKSEPARASESAFLEDDAKAQEEAGFDIAGSTWEWRGYRLSDSAEYHFLSDGIVRVTSLVGWEPWTATYQLEENRLTIMDENGECIDILLYDNNTDIFTSTMREKLTAQDYVDENGVYHEPEYEFGNLRKKVESN